MKEKALSLCFCIVLLALAALSPGGTPVLADDGMPHNYASAN